MMVHYIQYCCFFLFEPSFIMLKIKPLCFGCWLCFCIQVRMFVLLGPWIGISSLYQTQQNRHFHLKMGAEQAPQI
jgi:hypothetical protein